MTIIRREHIASTSTYNNTETIKEQHDVKRVEGRGRMGKGGRSAPTRQYIVKLLWQHNIRSGRRRTSRERSSSETYKDSIRKSDTRRTLGRDGVTTNETLTWTRVKLIMIQKFITLKYQYNKFIFPIWLLMWRLPTPERSGLRSRGRLEAVWGEGARGGRGLARDTDHIQIANISF